MTNISAIENKISHLQKYLKILKRYQKKYTQQQIEKDIDIRGMVERYLYLACQSAIDLAEAVIAFKGFRKPTTLSENFYILNEEKMISDALTEKMVKMTGFRNVIAQDYAKINYEIVYDVLQNRLKDLEEFLKETKEKLRIF